MRMRSEFLELDSIAFNNCIALYPHPKHGPWGLMQLNASLSSMIKLVQVSMLSTPKLYINLHIKLYSILKVF